VTGTTDSPDSSSERTLDDDAEGAADEQADEAADKSKRRRGALREGVILVVIAVGLYYLMLTFIARPYLIPSESMEPTLHGCAGCVGDRIMVDKLSYRFTEPRPGDVVVFKGPPNWNAGYKSIRSPNPAVRAVQNALSFVGFVQRMPQQLAEARDHLAHAAWVALHQAGNGVQRVEQEMRVQLRAERVKPRAGELCLETRGVRGERHRFFQPRLVPEVVVARERGAEHRDVHHEIIEELEAQDVHEWAARPVTEKAWEHVLALLGPQL